MTMFLLPRAALRSRHVVGAVGFSIGATALVSGGRCTTTTTACQSVQELSSSSSESGNRQLQSFLASSSSLSLLIPTAEATLRAGRLFSTAFLIAMDYKLADYSSFFVPDDGKNQERDYWEEETSRRRNVLEKSQEHYLRASHHHLPMKERVIAKRKEKEAMLEAAEQLAEAEDELASIGSRKSAVHHAAANRLLTLCRLNGGVYIKIGQHLANLDYILPAEYISTLSSLFDDTPKTSYEDVAAVIEEDLGGKAQDCFDGFEKEPIASASLAQVHVAYDKKTQRRLAIKVQHRGLRETSRGDIYALVTVVRLAERIFPDFSYGWLADEIAPHLPRELDFINEGKNAERAAAHLRLTKLDCVVPKIVWERTTPRVLVMEFEEGFKATDTDAMEKANIRRRDVANLVSSVFSSQVFSGPKGFVHCDPHPANVLVRRNNNTGKPQLVLLDHGLYRELDNDFRLQYAYLWKSLMLADLGGIKEACQDLGVGEAYPLFAAVILARPFDELIERSKRGTLQNNVSAKSKADQAIMKGYAQRYLAQIFELLATLPRQMLLLLKMNDCLRHIDYSLGSPTNTMVVCGRFAAEKVYKDTMLTTASPLGRFMAWRDYMQVLLRILLHDLGAWWLQQRGRLASH